MVERRGILIFVVSCAIIFGLGGAIAYGVGGASLQNASTGTTGTQTCPGGCRGFAIQSVALRAWNYTDELGSSGYSNLTLQLRVDDNATVQSFTVSVGGTKVDVIVGPFGPGTVKTFIIALPQTQAYQKGTAYQVTVEGLLGQSEGSVSPSWKTVSVTAG